MAVGSLPIVGFLILDRVFPFPFGALERPAAVVVEAEDGAPLRFFLPKDERWRLPLELGEMGALLPRAVVAAEDRRFGRHPGVDPVAVARAAWQDLRAGRIVSGASTIPMQIARMTDPAPRTFGAKLREAFRALQLTWHLERDDLLAAYLNLAPYGGNLEGVGAAAWFYFGKDPRQLSPGEIALLVALPRSPRRFDPTVDPAAARDARDSVLRRLGARGIFTREQVADALLQPVPTERRPAPFTAPHFTRFAVERAAGRRRIRTTLDRRMQRIAEQQVARRIDGLRARGVGNAAVVVIERLDSESGGSPSSGLTAAGAWRRRPAGATGSDDGTDAGESFSRGLTGSSQSGLTGAGGLSSRGLTAAGAWRRRSLGDPGGVRVVRAMVGSAGFGETAFSGQVNGAVARRSPGSTLKPFLYALALDRGLLMPDSYVLDVPTDFAGYVAENYDGIYHGRVTAREALVRSLNSPAVRLLSDVGLDDFHRLLVRGGLATLDRPPEAYGLPLVLGAGEVTLLDLTNLYATLAADGRHAPATWLLPNPIPAARNRSAPKAPAAVRPRSNQPPVAVRPLFSESAAWLVTEILTELRRPDLPTAWQLAVDVPPVAWKTGTSYRHRDAWAVGYSGRFTIGVWVGNFDGRPVKGISGSEDAGPLLFDLFRAVDPGGTGPRRPPALDVAPLEVCALSHQLPGPFCPERIRVPSLPGRSRPGTCAYHRRALVDAESGLMLAGACVDRRPHRWALLTVFPAELVAWWRAEGQTVPELPAASPACYGIPTGEPPHIVSPDPATPYRIRRGAPLGDQRIPLTARASAASRQLYWYQDGVLVAAAPASDRLFLTPAPGPHRLVVTDDLGRSDGVSYRVE